MSGPLVRQIVSGIFVPDDIERWQNSAGPGRHTGSISLPGVSVPLPVTVWLWPRNRSYTGQPTAELHTFGSPPLLESLLEVLFARGARPAHRGEFTLRAFLAGRIDLLQAEAVLGVIDATDDHQLRVALNQLGGGLTQPIAMLREDLLLHLADLEAGLDFTEEDLDFVDRDEFTRRLASGLEFLRALLEQAASRLQTSGRLKVVLAGLPNAGKSTLFNALCGSASALVSPREGTTRDYLTTPVAWAGQVLELIDTAGWDERLTQQSDIDHAADLVRQEQSLQADMVVWCTASDLDPHFVEMETRKREEMARSGVPVLRVATKAELGRSALPGGLAVSAVTGSGLEDLKTAILSALQSTPVENGILGATAARCRNTLLSAADALERARAAAATGLGDELVAVELREALDRLGQVAGQVYTDDVLDRIFSRFCIGK